MSREYLDTLPEVENKYKVKLEEDEKVVFTIKLNMFGTEKDLLLGMDPYFTLTNKRIVVDNKSRNLDSKYTSRYS
ncbi:MAG: hypothetical protein LBL91_04635 [Lachnospiraceae bacterium]|jgi:uncharacterized protein YpmS|nr:hypothetical protein [Lachnospiraceae bacterium]